MAGALTRLVVLPFRPLRPDPDTDFLGFSLPDAISTSLAGRSSLIVRSSGAAARADKDYELAIFHGSKHVLTDRAAERDAAAVRWFRRFDPHAPALPGSQEGLAVTAE